MLIIYVGRKLHIFFKKNEYNMSEEQTSSTPTNLDGFMTTENFVRPMHINKVCRQSLDGSGMFEAQQIEHFKK